MKAGLLIDIIALSCIISCTSSGGTGPASAAGVTGTTLGPMTASGTAAQAASGTGAPVAGTVATPVAGTGSSGMAAPSVSGTTAPLPTAGRSGASGMIASAAGASGVGAAAGVMAAGAGGAGSAGMTAAAGAGGMSSAGQAAAGMGAGGTLASGSGGNSGSGGALTLTSTAVMAGAKLPKKYRCMGSLGSMSGPSPALMWSGGPSALSYAVTLTDVTNNIYHWTLYDIPPAIMSLPEGVPLGAMPAMPAGAKQSPNSLTAMTGPGYYGPCGGASPNNYEYAVYALDEAALSGLTATSTAAQTRMAITMHTLPMGSVKLPITSSSADP